MCPADGKEEMSSYLKKALAGIAAVGALAVGGSALANATSSPSSSTSSTTATAPATPPAFSGPAHGTAAHEDAEKPVIGAAAAEAQTAAVKAVGGGTAGAVTTDFTQTGYEVTVTKSDGSTVEVHLDSSFNAFHQGGPGPRGSASIG